MRIRDDLGVSTYVPDGADDFLRQTGPRRLHDIHRANLEGYEPGQPAKAARAPSAMTYGSILTFTLSRTEPTNLSVPRVRLQHTFTLPLPNKVTSAQLSPICPGPGPATRRGGRRNVAGAAAFSQRPRPPRRPSLPPFPGTTATVPTCGPGRQDRSAAIDPCARARAPPCPPGASAPGSRASGAQGRGRRDAELGGRRHRVLHQSHLQPRCGLPIESNRSFDRPDGRWAMCARCSIAVRPGRVAKGGKLCRAHGRMRKVTAGSHLHLAPAAEPVLQMWLRWGARWWRRQQREGATPRGRRARDVRRAQSSRAAYRSRRQVRGWQLWPALCSKLLAARAGALEADMCLSS